MDCTLQTGLLPYWLQLQKRLSHTSHLSFLQIAARTTSKATLIPTQFLHTIMQLRSATSSCRGVQPVVAAVTAAAIQSRPRAQAASAAVPGSQQQRQQATMTNTSSSTTRTGAVFPEQYEEQLSAKVGQVRELFAAHKLPEIEVFRSATANFRMRAEFTIWHEVRSAAGLHMHRTISCCHSTLIHRLTASHPCCSVLARCRKRTCTTSCLRSQTVTRQLQQQQLLAAAPVGSKQTRQQQQQPATQTQTQTQMLGQAAVKQQSSPAQEQQQRRYRATGGPGASPGAKSGAAAQAAAASRPRGCA